MASGSAQTGDGRGSPGTRLADGLVALARPRGLGAAFEAAVQSVTDEAAALKAARGQGSPAGGGMGWDGLGRATAAAPALVGLRNGRWLLLLAIRIHNGTAVAVLADPRDPTETIDLDRIRFTDAWTGEAVMVRAAKHRGAPTRSAGGP